MNLQAGSAMFPQMMLPNHSLEQTGEARRIAMQLLSIGTNEKFEKERTPAAQLKAVRRAESKCVR